MIGRQAKSPEYRPEQTESAQELFPWRAWPVTGAEAQGLYPDTYTERLTENFSARCLFGTKTLKPEPLVTVLPYD